MESWNFLPFPEHEGRRKEISRNAGLPQLRTARESERTSPTLAASTNEIDGNWGGGRGGLSARPYAVTVDCDQSVATPDEKAMRVCGISVAQVVEFWPVPRVLTALWIGGATPHPPIHTRTTNPPANASRGG